MSQLFYGVAYYDEYMPEDRLASDIALMRETGINVVRIAESTWSTLEPEEGQYNFCLLYTSSFFFGTTWINSAISSFCISFSFTRSPSGSMNSTARSI